MKLTLKELKKMVKQTLTEEKGCAPFQKVEDEPEDGIEQAEDSLAVDQVVVRFYEDLDPEAVEEAVRHEILKALKQ